MKIHAEKGDIVLTEVFSGVLMRTPDGHALGICMRDGSFEINVLPKGTTDAKWHTVDMESGTIHREQQYSHYSGIDPDLLKCNGNLPPFEVLGIDDLVEHVETTDVPCPRCGEPCDPHVAEVAGMCQDCATPIGKNERA